jgi:putative ABC transport system ATP-binding protein
MTTISETAGGGVLYQLRAVARRYGHDGTTVDAVRSLDLAIPAGEFVVIAGPSGSGKSTLLQLLGGLDRASSGELLLDGVDLGRLDDNRLADLRLRTIGFVFQQFNLIPTLTAAQNVEIALAPQHAPAADRLRRVSELLAQVGLEHRSRHLPSQLSGGEQQRVAIARALANRPRILLADEPTGNLDSDTGSEILALLRSVVTADGKTLILVTHDRDVAALATILLRMRDGRIEHEARDRARTKTATSRTGDGG